MTEPPGGISSIVGTLGGPEVTRIFSHALTSCGFFDGFARACRGAELYAERALLAARRHDVVCLLEPVDRTYLDLLDRIGVGPRPENVVVVAGESAGPRVLPELLREDEPLRRIRELVRDARRIVLDVYTLSPAELGLAAKLESVLGRAVEVSLGSLEAVEWASHKHNVRGEALDAGVPVAPGEVVELASGTTVDLRPLEAAVLCQMEVTGRVLVRGSLGGSGTATTVIGRGREREALRRLAERSDNRIYLVEAMFEVSVSPNVQMVLSPDDSEIHCVGISDQILAEGLIHEGNLHPSRATMLPEMVAAAEKISRRLARRGYRGLVGLDFVECAGAHAGSYFLAEVNARVNAATYPALLVEHVNARQRDTKRPRVAAFLALHLKTAAAGFGELAKRWGRLFFDPTRGAGIVPYNVACLRHGKCGVALLGGSRDAVLAMRAAAEAAA